MKDETRNRLLGLNSLLSDLFGEDMLISQVLGESGLNDNQIERIRAIHLNEYLEKVTQNIFYLVAGALSERYAKIIRFCYYFDGKNPKINQNVESEYRKKLHRIYQLQDEAITSLRKMIRLQFFKSIFVDSAEDILKNESQYFLERRQMEKRRNVIKNSSQKIKIANKKHYISTKRPPTALSEERKKSILRKLNRKQSVPSRVIEQHKPERKMFNPWLGSDRYSSNWW